MTESNHPSRREILGELSRLATKIDDDRAYLSAARDDLAYTLLEGERQHIDITALAAAARVSRQTAYTLLGRAKQLEADSEWEEKMERMRELRHLDHRDEHEEAEYRKLQAEWLEREDA